MTKNHYYFTRVGELNFEDAGTNKREAIRKGREIAAAEKTSVQLWKCLQNSLTDTLSRHYVGILEFPYYLRDFQLTAADIVVNI